MKDMATPHYISTARREKAETLVKLISLAFVTGAMLGASFTLFVLGI